MKLLGADLACLISLVDSIEGQSLQNAQELIVFVLLESRIDELQCGLHAHRKMRARLIVRQVPLLELILIMDGPTPWGCASPGPHRWGEAFFPTPPYYVSSPLSET